MLIGGDNMSKFNVSLIPLKDSIESLNHIASDYRNCVEALSEMSIKFNRDGYEDFVVAINNIYKQASEDQETLGKMGVVLSDILNQYLQTEKLIMGYEEEGFFKAIGDIENLRDNELYKILKALAVRGLLGNRNLEALQQILGGIYITSGTANGVRHFKLVASGMTNAECAKWINENLGKTWTEDLVRRLRHGDMNVYNVNGKNLMRPSRFFSGVTDKGITDYLDDLGSFKGDSWKIFRNEFDMFADFNYKEFGEYTKLGKAGKVAGTLGTVLTIGTDVYDNFYDTDTGKWVYSGEAAIHTVCDVGVDLGVGAGAGAIGATVGSFIVPPVGTVVGAGVGIAVDVVANLDFMDFNGDGIDDSLVDGTKMLVKETVDVVWDGVEAAGKWFGDLF